MRKKLKKGKLYCIEWLDANTGCTWMNLDDAVRGNKNTFVISIGWVYAKDKQYLSICTCVGDASIGNRLSIPWDMITKFKHIKGHELKELQC